MRRLYARLKLRINEAKSAVARATERKFLGFSFWVAPGRKVTPRVASETWKRVKERVRMLTRRVVGQSMAAVCKEMGEYLAGWKAYFRIAETPRIFVDAASTRKNATPILVARARAKAGGLRRVSGNANVAEK
jgi:RNA-directed DNA polymerase